jgi:hypothetical protein
MNDDTTENYHRGNKFSREAHETAKHSKAKHFEIIKHFFRRRGPRGATCYQVELATGLSHQTASARVCDLKKKEHRYFLQPVLNPDGSQKRGPAASGPTHAGMWMTHEK